MTPDVPPKEEDKSQNRPDDGALSQVVLSQVLIEEYQALAQPMSDDSRFSDLKSKSCNGDTVKKIYQLINKVQQEHVADVRAQYETRFGPWINDAAARQQVVGQALLADVSGEMDELQEVVTEETKKDFPDIREEERLDALVENGLIRKLSERARNGGAANVSDQMAAKTLRSALCLSGGGIRSATFNLGILQGLARHGLLEKFDYLSTVSGGGFIGGWLSAWKKRAGLSEVAKELRKPPKTPLDPDPKPIEHLRIYSNYLSPQPGLLSADTWTLIATLIRNILLNWFVFVPVLLAILLVPRMWASIVLRTSGDPNSTIRLSWWIGFAAAVVALSYIALNLPTSNTFNPPPTNKRYKVRQFPFIFGCLIWLVVSACALSVFLREWQLIGYHSMPSYSYAKFAGGIVFIPWILFIGKILLTAAKSKSHVPGFRILAATFILGIIQIIIGYIASAVVALVLPLFKPHDGADAIGIAYSIFSTPLVLLLMAFEAVLISGLTSRVSNDDDQEWWARAGGWVLIVAVAWLLVHSLVLYGPLLLLNFHDTAARLSGGLDDLEWADWGKLAGTALGVISGVITLVGGFSAKTPANAKEAQKTGTGGLLLGLLTQVLAPVFLAFVIILLSLGTNWILVSRPWSVDKYLLPGVLSYSTWHCQIIERTPFPVLLLLLSFLIVLGAVLGRFISTNVFSLQYLWRNRIIRAYLGASHKEEDRHPNRFTNFDHSDNLYMHKLWPQPGVPLTEEHARFDDKRERKLFHILNLALNLTGGDRLQWQDRKAESFTVSPLHAGSYWLGYRRSTVYGGTGGITLGASVAISGAFVSPNMGYMMNSPIVRFLMALFNVRFGWWLGNPGPAGETASLLERLVNWPLKLIAGSPEQPFRHDSPGLSVIPFLSEAIGNIDDESSYVYLSDGGHFENLGLYEMVLRRCRFIVVCDATTDPDYSFESFAMSIRQIRVDLGVPIEMPDLAVGAPSQGFKNKYCAIGTIRYSCVDRNPDDNTSSDEEYDGTLIFIKPSLIGDEARDIINYWQSSSTFPQEVITDQWFSEAQFESYRALGSGIIDAICGDSRSRMNLANFEEKVRDHNLLNFRAFEEQLSHFALQEEFKEGMFKEPFNSSRSSYRAKVRKFMETILR
jgi:hypothetical protein